MSRVASRWVFFLTLCSAASLQPMFAGQSPVVPVPSPSSVPGPLERRAVTASADIPIPKRLETTSPLYPSEERQRLRWGTVTLQVTIDEAGNVAEVRRPFNPDMSVLQTADKRYSLGVPLTEPFAKSATDAVRQWRYEPPKRGPLTFFVRIAFWPSDPSTIVWEDGGRPPMSDSEPAAVTGRVPGGVPGGVVGGVVGAPPPPPPPPGTPVRVGGQIQPPRKIKDVKPEYPAIAQSARVQGLVIIEATISAEGKVVDTRILRGVDLLNNAALDAVRQWEFTPTLINGQPTPIIMSVTVNFTLGGPPAPAVPPPPAPPPVQ